MTELDRQLADKKQFLKTTATKLSQQDITELVRSEALGTSLSFQRIEARLQKTIDVIRELSKIDVDTVAEVSVLELRAPLATVQQVFSDISEFSATHSDATTIHANLEDRASKAYLELYRAALPPIIFEYMKRIDDERKKNDETLAKMKTANECFDKQFQRAGFAKESEHFKKEANAHRRAAWSWLVVTGLVVAGLIAYAWMSSRVIESLPADTPIRHLISMAAPRIIIVSVVWFIMVQCARNYTACRHNVVVNRHRQNAIGTFRIFTSTEADAATKNAILLEATKCIFAPQTTGYLKGESEPQSGSQILEIIRGIPAAKPPGTP